MPMTANMAAVNVKLNPLGVGVVALISASIVLYITGFPSFWSGAKENVNMRELLSVSIDLAQKAGYRVKEIREKENALQEKVKGKTDEGAKELMTEGDLQSHRTLVYGFAKAFPNLKVVSEEHDTKHFDIESLTQPDKSRSEVSSLPDSTEKLKNIAVWIDPLDATQEYTENLKQYVTVMVCVAVNGSPVMGVIHSPFSGETAWGWVGKGHSQDLTAADPNKAKKVGPYNIIVSRSHAGTVESVAKTAFGQETTVIPAGGAGYKTLQVIKGVADAYVHITKIKKWDICAGNAILNSVSGRMTNLHNQTIDYHAEGSPLNDNGLQATVYNHNLFLTSLRPLFDQGKKQQ